MRQNFVYHRASSTQEAIRLKASLGDHARFWAGGTDLMLWGRRKKAPIAAAIDITRLTDLVTIQISGNEILIGALTSLSQIERCGHLHPNLRVLAETARIMCTPQTRTIASIGGNICNASPGADLLPPLVALGATVCLQGTNGARELSLEKFVTGVGCNDLGGDEILTHIKIVNTGRRSACAYHRVARTAVDIALVSAAVYLSVDDNGSVAMARFSLGAVTPRPVRCTNAENAIEGCALETLLENEVTNAATIAGEYSNPISDIRASKVYRSRMCVVLTRRCLEDCLAQLKQEARK